MTQIRGYPIRPTTGTSSSIGFFGVTPVGQGAAIVAPDPGSPDLIEACAAGADVVGVLRDLGLITT